MKFSRALFLPLLFAFVLLFAQQAGAAHALHHALEDLAQQQQNDKQAHHSDVCEKCANYAQLGSALSAAVIDFAAPLGADATLPAPATRFHTIHALAATARAPPAA